MINKTTILELFSGIGSFSQAAKNMRINLDVKGISETDLEAVRIFESLHGKVKNFGPIEKISKEQLNFLIDKIDIITAGSPCQDFSQGGKMLGENGIRGKLLFETVRIVSILQPKWFVFENVKTLATLFRDTFAKFVNGILESGYHLVIDRVINAKEVNIPQNRERLFLVFTKTNCNDLNKKLEGILKLFKNEYQFTLEDFLNERWKFREFIDLEKPMYETTNYFHWYDNQGNLGGSYTRAWKISKFSGCINTTTRIKITDGKKVSYLKNEEMWELMGWSFDKFHHLNYLHSSAKKMQLIGNGIVIPILEIIFHLIKQHDK